MVGFETFDIAFLKKGGNDTNQMARMHVLCWIPQPKKAFRP